MAEQPQSSKTTHWLALIVGLGMLVFRVTMFVLMLWTKGLLDALPYVVAVIGGIYVWTIPRRSTRAQTKSNASDKR